MKNKINWNDKEEVRKYYREYYQKPEVKERRRKERVRNKEKYQGYRDKYNKKYPNRVNKKKIKGTIENEYYKKYQRGYQKKYINGEGREKYLLRQEVYHKLRAELIKLKKVCEVCGTNKNLETHHKKYINKLKYLMIVCKKCHIKIHNERRNKNKMESKLKAKEILDYCIEYLGTPNPENLETHEFEKTKRYKEMAKEIEFMLDTD